jgi:hypothetical protein
MRRIYRRWDAFDYTARLRVDCNWQGSRVVNGVLGVVDSDRKIRFYQPFGRRGKVEFQKKKQRTENSEADIQAVQPWIEHETEGHCSLMNWDERQDLLVYVVTYDSRLVPFPPPMTF